MGKRKISSFLNTIFFYCSVKKRTLSTKQPQKNNQNRPEQLKIQYKGPYQVSLNMIKQEPNEHVMKNI